MTQFLADNIDQLDLALEQLSINDRNFDRFAFMLIDNVLELTLHQFAKEKEYKNELSKYSEKHFKNFKLVSKALSQNFDEKVRGSCQLELFDEKLRDSILSCHKFRNTAYHQGLRHEGVLHSLALFYFQCTCEVINNYEPIIWSWTSGDKISYRTRKYIGYPEFLHSKQAFKEAFCRLSDVSKSMGDTLIVDLANDMNNTIFHADRKIKFLADEGPEVKTRNQVIIDVQVWDFAFTDKGKEFARINSCPEKNILSYVAWFSQNYSWKMTIDPIKGWQTRHKSLIEEKDSHLALKKYMDFINQTRGIRDKIDKAASNLDGYIQQQIDEARGK